jgi:hypothetical protein
LDRLNIFNFPSFDLKSILSVEKDCLRLSRICFKMRVLQLSYFFIVCSYLASIRMLYSQLCLKKPCKKWGDHSPNEKASIGSTVVELSIPVREIEGSTPASLVSVIFGD